MNIDFLHKIVEAIESFKPTHQPTTRPPLQAIPEWEKRVGMAFRVDHLQESVQLMSQKGRVVVAVPVTVTSVVVHPDGKFTIYYRDRIGYAAGSDTWAGWVLLCQVHDAVLPALIAELSKLESQTAHAANLVSQVYDCMAPWVVMRQVS